MGIDFFQRRHLPKQQAGQREIPSESGTLYRAESEFAVEITATRFFAGIREGISSAQERGD
jgi:hypothetical protein